MSKVCDVAGCDRSPRAKGLCGTHFSQWYRTGTTTARLRGDSTFAGNGTLACLRCGDPVVVHEGFERCDRPVNKKALAAARRQR